MFVLGFIGCVIIGVAVTCVAIAWVWKKIGKRRRRNEKCKESYFWRD